METYNAPKDLRNTIYCGLKAIKNRYRWTSTNQPWLYEQKSYSRPNTVAASVGQRAGQGGNVRPLAISDLGVVWDCERSFAATYAGENPPKKISTGLYRGKGASKLHDAIEKMLPADYFITHSSEEANGNRNRTWVRLPSIGKFTNPTKLNGKKFPSIGGHIDGYMPLVNAGLEIKTFPEGEEMPDALTNRMIGQAAGYMAAMWRSKSELKPEYWAWIFLPQDLQLLDPQDLNTYRVFIMSAEELQEAYQDLDSRIKRVAHLVDTTPKFQDALDELECHLGLDCQFCN